MLVLRVLCERGRATTDDALLSRLFPSVENAAAEAPEFDVRTTGGCCTYRAGVLEL